MNQELINMEDARMQLTATGAEYIERKRLRSSND
jgi:hypothetical protein